MPFECDIKWVIENFDLETSKEVEVWLNWYELDDSGMSFKSRDKHFVPMGAHLVYTSAQYRPNRRPWAQNVWLCLKG